MDYLVQMFGVLFVMALMAGLLWLLRRKGVAQFPMVMRSMKNKSQVLQTVDRLALTPQHSLHAVRVANRIIIIGVSPAGMTTLEQVPISEISLEHTPR